MASDNRAQYELAADGGYLIKDYDRTPAFSSFLPGIAGPNGVPLWCMYVNRAQGVVSFGVESKDRAIVEYLPATWAYQLVGLQGFRTFCKIDGACHEPFRALVGDDPDITRTMLIRLDSLELREANRATGLEIDVRYFSPVNQPLGSLARIVSITNAGVRPMEIDVLDGLPIVVPAGLNNFGLKFQRHINEAYAVVRRAGGGVPLYVAKVVAHDEEEVTRVEGGNFYAGWIERDGRFEAAEPIVDPGLIFGTDGDFVEPRRFITAESLNRDEQLWENRLPCGFLQLRTTLEVGQSVRLVALIGHAPNEEMLTRFLGGFSRYEDSEAALRESREAIESVVAPAATVSAHPALDAYAKQNYLDNVLRGGIPMLMPTRDGAAPIHLYARRHGDLERDYNHFVLPATPLSSGAGNYRDICQNRRCDVRSYPEIAEHEIRMFVELLQADGYNPLAIEGYRWTLDTDCNPLDFAPSDDPAARREFALLVTKPFQPGDVLDWLNRHAPKFTEYEAWLAKLLRHCDCRLVAHGHEGGYWIDHWTYIVDLLEQFEAIYPDRVANMLHRSRVGWFDEGVYVRPREEKYKHRPAGLMQLNAIGEIEPSGPALPPTTIFGKLAVLAAIRAVSFDASCRGIEMEAGRPSWNDAMNGLPGLFGSSACESAELARLASWLRRNAGAAPDTMLPIEAAKLVDEVSADLAAKEYDWDRAATIRENYRRRVRFAKPTADTGVGRYGESRVVQGNRLVEILGAIEKRARKAVEDSVDAASGLCHTYSVNEPAGADANVENSLPKQFTQTPLPLFLEGQVHRLRLLENSDMARAVYERVRRSPLFDQDLAMYKLNESLAAWPEQIGRARTFTPGWFENESIWLHMSYKYLLELLRAGLHREFFYDAKTMLVPFMDPRRYGRSILENCSFLGSSANPDPATRGRGFIARLSGSSAEFIQIWHEITVGPRPFAMKNGELVFQPAPTLPGEWFTRETRDITWKGETIEIPPNSFACALLGSILLVYRNETRVDTFGSNAAIPSGIVIDGCERVTGGMVVGEGALRIRNRECRRIDIGLTPTA